MHIATVAGLIAVLGAARAAVPSVPPDSVAVDTPVYRVVEPVRQPAERWVYDFSWGGFVKVAEVAITAGERPVQGETREIGVSIRAATSAVLDWVWRYRMNADGVIRLDPYRPGRLEVRESIKRGPKTTRVEFNGDGSVSTYRDKKGVVREYSFQAPNAFDLISTVYLVLNLDLAPGREFQVDTLAGNSRYLVTVDVVGQETVQAAGREHAALKLRVRSRDLTDPPDTEKHDHTELWVSAERPRRLLQAVSRLWVGAVRGQLVRIEQPARWPLPPPEIDLGLDARWLDGTWREQDREGGQRRVPELLPDVDRRRSGPFRPR